MGPDAEKRIADTLVQLTADDTLDAVFSRRRSYRKSQKKRVERLEEQPFAPSSPDATA